MKLADRKHLDKIYKRVYQEQIEKGEHPPYADMMAAWARKREESRMKVVECPEKITDPEKEESLDERWDLNPLTRVMR